MGVGQRHLRGEEGELLSPVVVSNIEFFFLILELTNVLKKGKKSEIVGIQEIFLC